MASQKVNFVSFKAFEWMNEKMNIWRQSKEAGKDICKIKAALHGLVGKSLKLAIGLIYKYFMINEYFSILI